MRQENGEIKRINVCLQQTLCVFNFRGLSQPTKILHTSKFDTKIFQITVICTHYSIQGPQHARQHGTSPYPTSLGSTPKTSFKT